jgi:hypothetical protein
MIYELQQNAARAIQFSFLEMAAEKGNKLRLITTTTATPKAAVRVMGDANKYVCGYKSFSLSIRAPKKLFSSMNEKELKKE